MNIPTYWAEARLQHKTRARQVTVRRWGWSDVSQGEAVAHAESRAQEALQAILAGKRLTRLEHASSYHGAQGLPIREEVVKRFGELVITRNAYGALCLNTPNVLFADVDFRESVGGCLFWPLSLSAMLVSAGVAGFYRGALIAIIALVVVGLLFECLLTPWLHRMVYGSFNRQAQQSLAKLNRFLASRPDWNVIAYRTPAGMRYLATHRLFDPNEEEVKLFFRELGCDPVYVYMCQEQQCFRARLTPKPWRVGVTQHIKPRSNKVPVPPEVLPERRRWIEHYEEASRGYAACRKLDSYGSGIVVSAVREVQSLHDDYCQAGGSLPLA